MKTRILTFAPLAAGLLLASNVAAQDHSRHAPPATSATQDHSQHQAPVHAPARQPAEAAQEKPAPSAETDHAAMDHAGHQQPPAEQDHAAMGHAEPKAEQPVDHAAMGHVGEQPETAHDPSATGHPAPEPPTPTGPVDHSAMGHHPPAPVDHAAMGHAPPASDEPRTPIPEVTDADRAAATRPRHGHPAHDNTTQSFVLFNRLEAFDADDGNGFEWEGQAWIGTDLNKLWLRSEGEQVDGHTEAADLEVLYGRAFAPWWDFVAGVRHDFEPGASQDFVAFGVVGLAPYKFELEATGYLGESGQTAARLEAEYETLFTNRLILQPLVELNFYGKDDAQRGIGSGLSSAEAGLRLRYEIARRFAPYVGVVREWTFGDTADFRRDEGDPVNDTRVVAGIRVWF